MELDQIKIEGLEIFANHGVFPEENVLGQKFIVSATLYTDTRKAGKTDEPVSYTHLTLPTNMHVCRSRWSPYH